MSLESETSIKSALDVAAEIAAEVGLQFIDFGYYEDPSVPEDSRWTYEIYSTNPDEGWTLKVHPTGLEGESAEMAEEMTFDVSQTKLFRAMLKTHMRMNELTTS